MPYIWRHLGQRQIEDIEDESTPLTLEYTFTRGQVQVKAPPDFNHMLQLQKRALWGIKREEYQIIITYRHNKVDDTTTNITLTATNGSDEVQYTEKEPYDPLKALIFLGLLKEKELTYESCANAKVSGNQTGTKASILEEKIEKLILTLVDKT